MTPVLPWSLDEDTINYYLSPTCMRISHQSEYHHTLADHIVYRFDFYLNAGISLYYFMAALATWIKIRTGSEAGLHYYVKLENSTSENSFILFYNKEDAALFALAFLQEN